MFSLLLSGMAGGIFQSRLKEKVVRGHRSSMVRMSRTGIQLRSRKRRLVPCVPRKVIYDK